MEQVLSAIGSVVGEGFLRPATAADSVQGVAATWVVEPSSQAQVAGVLKLCDEAGLRVVARGGGTKLDWGNPPLAADLILSTRHLNKVLEHAAGDMTAIVQAGCALSDLQSTLAQRGQRLALDPLWPAAATLGGIIATNDSGPLRAAFGTVRDHLIGITVALADGTLARSGGKVVKNVAGYDLPKLFAGSFGTLGVITQAIFRLYPLPQTSRTLQLIAPTTQVLARLLAALSDCSLVTSGIQFEAEIQGPIRVSVLVEGLSDAMEAKTQRVIRAGMDCDAQRAEPTGEVWQASESLFSKPDSCIGKLSLLPTAWPDLIDRMREVGNELNWKMVAQSVGVGLLRITSQNAERLLTATQSIRTEVEKIGGSLVVLRRPLNAKPPFDSWPQGGDALPLMRQIKEQFDPRRTLSPGRFVGGI